MVISLYDVKQKELVWRGIAENTLSNNGNKNQKMVEKAVQKMFKQWPKSEPGESSPGTRKTIYASGTTHGELR